ncbi:hypothetical protein Aiant_37150 [Actinoplanes ianthinogenes]|uniref:Secreted protein n=1 Tax=Actinoplanes ianthinogenes TaxID=122358 RepID=A0ABN6CFB4_9ACTN|nr:hypothetical protein Aiant_37150 [Actinoplanes ianthinogenes]
MAGGATVGAAGAEASGLSDLSAFSAVVTLSDVTTADAASESLLLVVVASGSLVLVVVAEPPLVDPPLFVGVAPGPPLLAAPELPSGPP